MGQTMRAMVKARPAAGNMEFQDVPKPALDAHDVLIKVKVTSICGTDVHIYDWDAWSQARIKTPLIQGHEFAGEIVEVGSHVSAVKVGDYVSAEGHIACNRCLQCRIGQGHICQNVKIIGIDQAGSFAEYIRIPEHQVWKNDPALPLEIASIQDPLGNAVHTCFNADIPGNTVAIFGLGPIGLMCVSLAKTLGAARIFAIGRKNEFRMNLAKELGAHHVLKEGEELDARIKAETGGVGVDEVLEMSGSATALHHGLKVLRPGGGLHLLGIFPKPVEVDLSKDVIFKGITVHGINGRRMWDTWYRMAGLLRSGVLNLKPIFTHKLKFSEFPKAMEAMHSGESGKVVMFLD